ncbi:MAG: hypothetical protein Ct9H90mP5_05860 [Acidimicrobiaceae bacterium]|nr:MAG: hypothetical protein Ct9H90mP5_05860 [Acidimicrobiaceae bacterium]
MNQSELLESLKGEEWLKEIRKSALTTAGELKFPTGQQEKWKYSPIHKLSLDHKTCNSSSLTNQKSRTHKLHRTIRRPPH